MTIQDIYKNIQNVQKPGQKIRKYLEENFKNLNSLEKQKLYNKIYSKWYRDRNLLYFKKKNQDWREKNPNKMKIYMRNYYQEHKDVLRETIKENRKKRFEENPESKKNYLMYQKKYREINRK